MNFENVEHDPLLNPEGKKKVAPALPQARAKTPEKKPVIEESPKPEEEQVKEEKPVEAPAPVHQKSKSLFEDDDDLFSNTTSASSVFNNLKSAQKKEEEPTHHVDLSLDDDDELEKLEQLTLDVQTHKPVKSELFNSHEEHVHIPTTKHAVAKPTVSSSLFGDDVESSSNLAASGEEDDLFAMVSNGKNSGSSGLQGFDVNAYISKNKSTKGGLFDDF